MPYPSEHAARLQEPNFDDYRRTDGGTIYGSIKVPSTISIIWGHNKKDPKDAWIPQALRFPIDKWTVAKAKQWLEDNKIKFIKFEPASDAGKAKNQMNINWLYTINPDDDKPIILINKHIGWDDELGYGIMGDQFTRELYALDSMGKKEIDVYINSPGGSVKEGMDIYTAMLRTQCRVNTVCTGMAASIAGAFFQAGRTRTMLDFAQLMYHDPYDPNGESDKGLEALADSIATMISTRTKKTIDEIKNIMAATTWMDAETALKENFCDEIDKSADFNKKRTISTPTEAKAFWKEAALVTNSILKINNFNQKASKMDLTQINNKLGLLEEASPASTLAAIDKLKNEAEEAKKESEDCKDELKTLKDEFQKKQEELDALKNKIKAMEEEKQAEDKKNKAKDAKNAIAGYVKLGAIKNDPKIIAEWEDMFVESPEKVQNMLGSLPVHVAGKHIEQPGGGGQAPKIGSVIASELGKIQDKFYENKAKR